MDELIMKLEEARYAIQSHERFAPTERNCNLILASIQRLNDVIAALSEMKRRENAENERNTP